MEENKDLSGMGRGTVNRYHAGAGLLVAAALLIGCRSSTIATQPSDLNRIAAAFSQPDSVTILVAAHRGAHDQAPENSLAAFQNAIDLGADFIETDVRQTRDGELILMHDDKVDRTTDGSGLVKEKTLADISRLFLSGNQRVPTLRQALELVRGRIFLDLDIKSAGVEKIVRLLQETGTRQQVLLFGSVAKLDSLIALDRTLLIMPRAKTVRDLQMLFQRYHPPAMHVDASFFRSTDAAPWREQGAHIWLNALLWPDIKAMLGGAEWGYAPLLHSGATIIQTDRPQHLLRYLRQHNRHW